MSLRRASDPATKVDGSGVNPARRVDRSVAKGARDSVEVPAKAAPLEATNLTAPVVGSSMFPAEYWAATDEAPAGETSDESKPAGSPDDAPKSGRTRRKKVEDLPREEQLEKAQEVVLFSLSASAKTRKELEDKLAGKNYPEDVIAQVLDRMTEVGLIDDAAYAKAFTSSRHEGRGLSASAIRRELQRKGIDKDVADEAVTEIDPEDEWARAYELASRRARSTTNLDKDARVRRLVSMLARKGYGGGVAYGVVKQVLADEGDALDGHLDSGEE